MSGAMLKKHLSRKEGAGTDPGDVHWCRITSRKSGGAGIESTDLIGSEKSGLKDFWEVEGASPVAGGPSCAACDALKSKDLNTTGEIGR